MERGSDFDAPDGLKEIMIVVPDQARRYPKSTKTTLRKTLLRQHLQRTTIAMRITGAPCSRTHYESARLYRQACDKYSLTPISRFCCRGLVDHELAAYRPVEDPVLHCHSTSCGSHTKSNAGMFMGGAKSLW